ncbi:MAG: IS30 family transposase [Patescibacteria group bacterium]|nr:IS30 family transposase [Patescibacteria group bacterium]MDE2016062.1 IS30 family transposase [Patescibacteria group bacterium]
MANKKKHLSFEERFCIRKLLVRGKSFGEIGRTLCRGISTISEEVNENGGREFYDPNKAERRAYWKQYLKKRECNKVAMDGSLSRFVEKCLAKGWSPETISARLKKKRGLPYASPKAIRKFIDRRPSLERFLFWNRNDHKSGRKRRDVSLNDPGRKFIDIRPYQALFSYGHWEGDFIVSKHNSFVLLVLVEKFSKTLLIRLLPNRKNDLVNKAIASALAGYSVKSLTLDNDIAFGKWKVLEQNLGIAVYFCHAYHSWEKGLVENTNRWIRQFVPRRANLQLISKEELRAIEDWFNHTPRQCLDGAAPYEKMTECEFKKEVESLEINLPILRIWG